MMSRERKVEILELVHRYNLDDSERTPLSPFIARHDGVLDRVAEKIGVPTGELDEFLTIIDRELPNDHLVG